MGSYQHLPEPSRVSSSGHWWLVGWLVGWLAGWLPEAPFFSFFSVSESFCPLPSSLLYLLLRPATLFPWIRSIRARCTVSQSSETIAQCAYGGTTNLVLVEPTIWNMVRDIECFLLKKWDSTYIPLRNEIFLEKFTWIVRRRFYLRSLPLGFKILSQSLKFGELCSAETNSWRVSRPGKNLIFLINRTINGKSEPV